MSSNLQMVLNSLTTHVVSMAAQDAEFRADLRVLAEILLQLTTKSDKPAEQISPPVTSLLMPISAPIEDSELLSTEESKDDQARHGVSTETLTGQPFVRRREEVL